MKTNHFLNYTFLFVLFAALFVGGCAQLSKTLNDNEVLSYIAVKNSTAQYIDKTAKTEAGKKAKASRVLAAANKAELFIDTNPTASIGTVVDVVKANANYGGLSIVDKMLIDDLLFIATRGIKEEQTEKSLPDNYVVDLKKVISYIKAGATPFL